MWVGGVDKAKNVRRARFEFARAAMERRCERGADREPQQSDVEEDRRPPRLFVEGIECLVGSDAGQEWRSLSRLHGDQRSMRNRHGRVCLAWRTAYRPPGNQRKLASGRTWNL